MNELTLKFDYEYSFNKEFELYLLSQQGVLGVKINESEDKIDIKYDNKLITLERLNYEIQLFLGTLNIPTLLSFNKHSKQKTTKYIMIIKHICCEYCLKGMLEELLLIKGIEKVNTNYNIWEPFNKENILFYIEYDKTLIHKETILSLENKFNC